MDAFSMGMISALEKVAAVRGPDPRIVRALTWMGSNPELTGMVGGGAIGAALAPDAERRRGYLTTGMAVGAIVGAARRGRTFAGSGGRRAGVGGPASPVGVPGI